MYSSRFTRVITCVIQNSPTKIYHNVENFSQRVAIALRSKKPKSTKTTGQHFVDLQTVRTKGGSGGDGCISFLQLWANEHAGPDGGDGGHGGHVVFQSTHDVRDLNHVKSVLKADNGEKGSGQDCHGKNASHTVIKVPVGTIIKGSSGKIIGDLSQDDMMFVAARGGAGGKGNHFFVSDVEQAPQISEYGAQGEDFQYTLELRSMAHVGLIGLPNAGKSTLLRAISRARPKVASYPFTTLRPHIGMVQYDDYQQIAVADLPGLIPGSHQNRGLGIQFLKHAERCTALLFILDMSEAEPWNALEMLQKELALFNMELLKRPQIIIANKMDLKEAEDNLEMLKENVTLPVISISAKVGTNIEELLTKIRMIYDDMKGESELNAD